jgi:hypothetical protein
MLTRIFKKKKGEEVTRGWKKIHKFHNLFSSPDIIRMTRKNGDESGGECSTHEGHKKSVQLDR